MEKLRIYRIRDGFIEFLHEKDHRVQFNKRERRPYIGVVLEINGHKYFVPMESPKPNHEKLKSNVHIMRIDGGKYGILGFNNMVPAKDFFLVPFDIEKEPDERYKNLLRNQLKFCNDHKEDVYRRNRWAQPVPHKGVLRLQIARTGICKILLQDNGTVKGGAARPRPFVLSFGRTSAPAVCTAEAKRERFIYSGDVALAVITDLDVIILLVHRQMKNLLSVASNIALDERVFSERNVGE